MLAGIDWAFSACAALCSNYEPMYRGYRGQKYRSTKDSRDCRV